MTSKNTKFAAGLRYDWDQAMDSLFESTLSSGRRQGLTDAEVALAVYDAFGVDAGDAYDEWYGGGS